MRKAYLTKSDQEALEIAHRFANQIETESAERDKNRRLPLEEIELFSQSGLWGITVPKLYGGAGVSAVTFVKAIALVQRIICFQSTTTPRKCFLDAPIALNPLWNQVIQRTSCHSATPRSQSSS